MKHKFTFGFIGAFASLPEIELLEKLIISFAKGKESPHFLIIGDGLLLQGLKENLQKSDSCKNLVTFTGKVLEKQRTEYLAKCDTYLCPTQPDQDILPIRLFEYMSMAKPIIASSLEHFTKIINPAVNITGEQTLVPLVVNDEAGVLIDPLDVQGFFNACRFCFYLSPEMRQKMGNNAHQKALKIIDGKSIQAHGPLSKHAVNHD